MPRLLAARYTAAPEFCLTAADLAQQWMQRLTRPAVPRNASQLTEPGRTIPACMLIGYYSNGGVRWR